MYQIGDRVKITDIDTVGTVYRVTMGEDDAYRYCIEADNGERYKALENALENAPAPPQTVTLTREEFRDIAISSLNFFDYDKEVAARISVSDFSYLFGVTLRNVENALFGYPEPEETETVEK